VSLHEMMIFSSIIYSDLNVFILVKSIELNLLLWKGFVCPIDPFFHALFGSLKIVFDVQKGPLSGSNFFKILKFALYFSCCYLDLILHETVPCPNALYFVTFLCLTRYDIAWPSAVRKSVLCFNRLSRAGTKLEH
jgi:hypothetical protein